MDNGNHNIVCAIFVYPECVFYEIILLSCFVESLGGQVLYVTAAEDTIQSWEGVLIKSQKKLHEIDVDDITCFVLPGGSLERVIKAPLIPFVRSVVGKRKILAAICTSVDLLYDLDVMSAQKTVRTTQNDIVIDGSMITALSSAYVDFALSVIKALALFKDDAHYQQTALFFNQFKATLSPKNDFGISDCIE